MQRSANCSTTVSGTNLMPQLRERLTGTYGWYLEYSVAEAICKVGWRTWNPYELHRWMTMLGYINAEPISGVE
jgi:hypothetical protein